MPTKPMQDVLQIRVPLPLLKGLKLRAKRAGISVSELVREYLRGAVDGCPTCGGKR